MTDREIGSFWRWWKTIETSYGLEPKGNPIIIAKLAWEEALKSVSTPAPIAPEDYFRIGEEIDYRYKGIEKEFHRGRVGIIDTNGDVLEEVDGNEALRRLQDRPPLERAVTLPELEVILKQIEPMHHKALEKFGGSCLTCMRRKIHHNCLPQESDVLGCKVYEWDGIWKDPQ